MKNMMKKFLAMFAALAIMMTVVMPVFESSEENTVMPLCELWDEDDLTDRD